ncbi:MAG TPA: 23S rRNA (guanosine(2251)-2'-O)-methyltransferase RlmB [Polyangiaceae bacterium]|nr:23S rRNA (guanosine(2251)-2'-O)-methyltransferase RlmB [Polyangiaceae bacterium]
MRLVMGVQPVREAVRAHGAHVEKLFVEEGDHPQLEALARFARDQGVREVSVVARAELDRRARGVRHQGAMALVPELRLARLSDVAVAPASLFLALDEIQDPQNFGAVIRSAVAFGASAVLWPEHSSAPLSAATFRASAGAIEHAVLCRVGSLPSALQHLTELGTAVIGLDANGELPLAQIDLTGPVAFVIGSEGKGLKKSVRRACASVAKLPMAGAIGSLNASVAAAITLYEACRQRAASRNPS